MLQIIRRLVRLGGLLPQPALQLGEFPLLVLHLLGCVGQLLLLALDQPLLVAESGLQVVLGLLGPGQIHLGILHIIGCFVRLCSLLLQLALELGDSVVLGFGILNSIGQVPLQALDQPLLVTEGGFHIALGFPGRGQISLGLLQIINCFVCFRSLLLQLALELSDPLALGMDLLGGVIELPLLTLHQTLLVAQGGLQVALGFLGPSEIRLGVFQVISDLRRLGRFVTKLALQLSDPLALSLDLLGGVSQLPLLALHKTLLVTEIGLQVALGHLGFLQINLGILEVVGHFLCLGRLLPQLPLQLSDPLAVGLDVLGHVSQLAPLALHQPLLVGIDRLQVSELLLKLQCLTGQAFEIPLLISEVAVLAVQFGS